MLYTPSLPTAIMSCVMSNFRPTSVSPMGRGEGGVAKLIYPLKPSNAQFKRSKMDNFHMIVLSANTINVGNFAKV